MEGIFNVNRVSIIALVVVDYGSFWSGSWRVTSHQKTFQGWKPQTGFAPLLFF